MNATKVCWWRRRRKESTRLKAKASSPQRKPPWEGLSCGKCGGQCEPKNFEGAGCERNGAVRVKRSGVPIALDDRDDKAGLPSGRNHSEAQNEVEEGKQKMTPPRGMRL